MPLPVGNSQFFEIPVSLLQSNNPVADYLWWDIYRIIDDYSSGIPASKLDDEVGSYLVNQFLLFLKISKLDPPNALRISNFSHPCGFRILAEAIRNSGEFDKISKLQKLLEIIEKLAKLKRPL